MVDEYTILKSIHVLFAAFWVGGGFALNLMMFLAPRSGERANMLGAMRFTRFFGQWVLPVLALVVVASGIWLTERFYAWEELWIQLGLAGAVLVTAIGMFYLGPRAARAIAGLEAGQPPPPGRNWAPIVARLNLVLISTVLVLMVIRPS